MYIHFWNDLKYLQVYCGIVISLTSSSERNVACFHVVARPEGTLSRVCTSEPLNPQSSYRELSRRTRRMFVNELISSIITLKKHHVARHQ